MGILIVLIPLALVLAAVSIAGYIWAVKSGQFDDLDTPAHRILFEDHNLEERKKRHDN
ncbi:MAG: cbb3-type cytochrome oxidase assembly protein CcoS [Acidobacteria bacterium]|nr:MAG: cbb3-type cytochrome oxidase assembly protein CcoS [Acidobacteriota bacterium]PIE91225.1 MAG: cbb3-type cytochrome oxidase assembly protein CcoS [Acidobacteriota bacterium]